MQEDSPERARLLAAYRAASAEHKAAAQALRTATIGPEPPDPALLQRQGAAAMKEFEALAALRRWR